MQPDNSSLSLEQITAMGQRGFGSNFQIQAIRKLGGGTFNEVHLITSTDGQMVVLRVSPPEPPDTNWEERLLMRREHAMQPYFAPVAALMPHTLLVDFTHQLIDRDFMFQSFIEGERWEDVMEDWTTEENLLIWDQFGRLLKTIHSVQGETFGLPLLGFQFPSWNQAVIDRLERTLRAAQDDRLAIPHLTSILDRIRVHPQHFDEIQVPCLLHGDLWSFNILVRRTPGGPAIVGLLDADRAWWGDPMADWTMFILTHAEPQEGHARFWRAYGPPADSPSARFRASVYDAMHAGTAFVWASRHHDDETLLRATGTLSEVAEALG